VATGIERQFSLSGPAARAVRHLSAPPDYAFWARASIGLGSALGELRATNHWGSIADEYLRDAPPLTPMGRRERAFFERRERACDPLAPAHGCSGLGHACTEG
jgi:hypothetical protein